MEKYVIISAIDMPDGTRVLSPQITKHEAEHTLEGMRFSEVSVKYGPLGIVTVRKAEKYKMFGDWPAIS